MTNMRCRRSEFWACVVLALLSVSGAARADESTLRPADGCPRTVYFTTGDHQDLLWLPFDSKASIDTCFRTLRERYKVERIWWRGGQDEVWGNEFVLRPENRPFERVWQWWRHLQYEKVKTNRLAREATRANKQQLWMAYGLFDNGSGPDVGFTGFPYAMEDRLRVEHPEYAPLNRWGTWRQGGPVEFAYPGMRKGMVEYLTKHLVAGGYDGIAFLTYAENYSQRYEDEFGFSELVMAEFQRRHGVDPRVQAFDKSALQRLRGEYLTQFFRELRTSLAKHGIQVAVCVDGANPELPTLWSMDGGVRTAGPIHFDLATWAKEGLVQEVCVWAPKDDEAKALTKCRDLFQGTQTVASCFRTRGTLPAGTPRVMFPVNEIESGFDWENYIDFDDEQVPPQSADALTSGDAYARRRLLTAVAKKKQALPLEQVAQATTDPDLYVRRIALRILGASGDVKWAPAAQAALGDGEHSVRLNAAVALAELAGAKAIEPLFAAIARDPDSFQLKFRAVPEALLKLQQANRLSATDKEPIVTRLDDELLAIRESALFTFQRIGAPATPAVETALLKILKSDPSPYAREMALVNLRSSFGATATFLAAVRRVIDDKDDSLSVRALATLAQMGSHFAAERPLRDAILKETETFFRRYGDGCTRTDKDWGWRIAGEALLGFGPDGEKVLQGCMDDKSNRRLADLAWRIVFLRQSDRFHRLSEADDRRAHARHPFGPLPGTQAEEPTPLPYDVKAEPVFKELTPAFCWFHPRVAPLPGFGKDGRPAVVMTIQKHLSASDHYSGMYFLRTDDLGQTWTRPTEIPELAWQPGENNETIAVCDVTPGWHAPSGKLLAIGIKLRYSPQGAQLLDKPRSHECAYATFDPKTQKWTSWKMLAMPETEGKFFLVSPGCVQWLVNADGTLLIPTYFRGPTGDDYITTVLHCSFDGSELKYLKHGDELGTKGGRGFVEPSLALHHGTYYLTLRNDAAAYVTTSADGLHFQPVKKWTFDDGQDLGSFNTQAHWLNHSGGLFLTYTRRGANNDHIARNRAPIFVAQVDPAKLQVLRKTERALLPERGVMLGNFGATAITPEESWVTDAEYILTGKPHAKGADGTTWLGRVQWSKPNQSR